jgi:hypothetical protein
MCSTRQFTFDTDPAISGVKNFPQAAFFATALLLLLSLDN